MAPEICTRLDADARRRHLVDRRDAVRGDDRREPVPRPLARRARRSPRRAPAAARGGAPRPRPAARRGLRPRALRDPRRRPTAASLATVFEAAADRLEAPAPARASSSCARARRAARPAASPRRAVPRPALRAAARSRCPPRRGALGATASTLLAGGIPARSPSAPCAIARRAGPGVAAVVAVEAMLRSFPFWPASLTTPLAVACGGAGARRALVGGRARRSPSACPALGNLSSALAWALALLGVLWLGALARARAAARCCRRSRRPRSRCSRSPPT